MKIAVTDANIFIDILFLELHVYLPDLDLDIYTTRLVFGELEEDQIAKLEGVIVYQFSDEEQVTLDEFQVKKGLSDADHSVIFLAELLAAMVISGDSLVRKTCQERKLEVHGILWLLDECIRKNHLTPEQAHLKLTQLMEVNNRLPKKDCDERLEIWNKKE
jgi:predicted nucleic acid-binding protein